MTHTATLSAPAASLDPGATAPRSLQRIASHWRAWLMRGMGTQVVALSAEERRLLAQAELFAAPARVSARASGFPLGSLGFLLAEETALAGLWHVREFDAAGNLVAERLEIGTAPSALVSCAQPVHRSPRLQAPSAPGLAALWRDLVEAGADASNEGLLVFNVTLLALAAEDQLALDMALGHGPVKATVDGLHRTEIESTGLDRVWRVRYFSAGQRLALDTIEVTALPASLCTSREDSALALARLERWLLQTGGST